MYIYIQKHNIFFCNNRSKIHEDSGHPCDSAPFDPAVDTSFTFVFFRIVYKHIKVLWLVGGRSPCAEGAAT